MALARRSPCGLGGRCDQWLSFFLQKKRYFPAAWELLRTWKREEHPLQAPPLTGPLVFALKATALAWNLTGVVVLIVIGYVDSTPHTSLFLCTMGVLNNVLHNTSAQVSARARFTSSTWSSTLCGCPFFDSLFLALFVSVCVSYLSFFYLNPELNLFLHVVVIGAIYHWHSAK